MKTYTEKEVIELLKKQVEACVKQYKWMSNNECTYIQEGIIRETALVISDYKISNHIETIHFGNNRIADILFISHKGFDKLEEEIYSQVHNYLGLDVIITYKLKDYDFKLIKL